MKRTVLPVLAVLAMVLSGCATAGASGPQPTPTPSAPPPTASAAVPTEFPTPAATPAAAVAVDAASATCATVLTDDAVDELEADGFTLNPDVFALDDVMTSVMADGFGCFWNRGGGDVRVWYAQAAQDATSWADREEELLDDGWTRIDGIMAGAIQAPTDTGKDYIPAMLHRAGTTHYVSYAELLTAVVALQPE